MSRVQISHPYNKDGMQYDLTKWTADISTQPMTRWPRATKTDSMARLYTYIFKSRLHSALCDIKRYSVHLCKADFISARMPAKRDTTVVDVHKPASILV